MTVAPFNIYMLIILQIVVDKVIQRYVEYFAQFAQHIHIRLSATLLPIRIATFGYA